MPREFRKLNRVRAEQYDGSPESLEDIREMLDDESIVGDIIEKDFWLELSSVNNTSHIFNVGTWVVVPPSGIAFVMPESTFSNTYEEK